jgi:hypothetical protein
MRGVGKNGWWEISKLSPELPQVKNVWNVDLTLYGLPSITVQRAERFMKKFIFYLMCGISIKLIAYLFGLIKNPPSWLMPDVQARMIVMGACICVAIAFWYVVLGMGKKNCD